MIQSQPPFSLSLSPTGHVLTSSLHLRGKKEIRILPLESISEAEKTEFILLIQSLYGRIRTLPVSELLASQDLGRDLLAHSIQVSQPGPDGRSREESPFSRGSKDIQRHTFNTAEMSSGTFTFSVQFLSMAEIQNQVLGRHLDLEASALTSPPGRLPAFGSKAKTQQSKPRHHHGKDTGDDDDGFKIHQRTVWRETEAENDSDEGGTEDGPSPGRTRGSSRGARPIAVNTSRNLTTQNYGSPIPSPKSHASMLSFLEQKYAKSKLADNPADSHQPFTSPFGNLEDVRHSPTFSRFSHTSENSQPNAGHQPLLSPDPDHAPKVPIQGGPLLRRRGGRGVGVLSVSPLAPPITFLVAKGKWRA